LGGEVDGYMMEMEMEMEREGMGGLVRDLKGRKKDG
jgi:uncharacterized protein (DUF3820 family)